MNRNESTANSAPVNSTPISAAEAEALFSGLHRVKALVLAVSGGPDSTALLLLAARWRVALERGPDLLAVTVDHGWRSQSAQEARGVKECAHRLGVRHRTLTWAGAKPATGLQEAARAARYRLLVDAAKRIRASHLLTAHTLDDQAETVLIRMARGSGLTGLCAMARETPFGDVVLVRPFLHIAKSRLIATLEAQGIAFADDPSNHDPRFTRARLRRLMPPLAEEGLDAPRLATLARRLRRAEQAIEFATDAAAAVVPGGPWGGGRAIVLGAQEFFGLPAEIALRLLGRAVECHAHEGPVQLSKLEALCEALDAARRAGNARLRRTLAGALVTLTPNKVVIEAAPARTKKGG